MLGNQWPQCHNGGLVLWALPKAQDIKKFATISTSSQDVKKLLLQTPLKRKRDYSTSLWLACNNQTMQLHKSKIIHIQTDK